ncbi:hypothetical protein MKJ04_08005 [Pontibacter sp. E15-1]|uniref:hypothetical protein n=1 Tax=Pontibacter sp. E15-1 TaxID=2919918 RepID=UPI001F4F76EF|nr:hypothetical protein [Pontibacter sp. E15-1]MCJ8164784.1 hypothetical protein [Pontibacter sp. E15-1]
MKFLLKITIFLALILISKYAKEDANTTSSPIENRPATTVFTIYKPTGDVTHRQDEGIDAPEVQTIY